jgi:hypothetical protein
MPELRPEWLCTACGVRCYKATGEPFPAPEGWDHHRDRCISCASIEDPEAEARALLMKGVRPKKVQSLLPTLRPNFANALRDELIEAGDLDPELRADKSKEARPKEEPREPSPPPPPNERHQRVKEVLAEDPERTDHEIAAIVGGISRNLVGGIRRKLGVKNYRLLRREAATRLLEAEPITNAEAKRRLKHPPSGPVLSEIRRELADRP